MRTPHLVSAALALLVTLAACTNLTSPPAPEPIASETPSASASAPKPPPPPTPPPIASASAAPPAPPTPSADAGPPVPLQMKDLVVGKGAAAKTGDKVAVQYTGTLTDGKEFDSTKKRNNKPFEFTLGRGQVIKGWDQGVVGMKVGGKRKLVIPPDLGYGPRGHPPVIPPNSTLQFEIELQTITPGQ